MTLSYKQKHTYSRELSPSVVSVLWQYNFWRCVEHLSLHCSTFRWSSCNTATDGNTAVGCRQLLPPPLTRHIHDTATSTGSCGIWLRGFGAYSQMEGYIHLFWLIAHIYIRIQLISFYIQIIYSSTKKYATPLHMLQSSSGNKDNFHWEIPSDTRKSLGERGPPAKT